jgi:hypothetical protein
VLNFLDVLSKKSSESYSGSCPRLTLSEPHYNTQSFLIICNKRGVMELARFFCLTKLSPRGLTLRIRSLGLGVGSYKGVSLFVLGVFGLYVGLGILFLVVCLRHLTITLRVGCLVEASYCYASRGGGSC